MDAVEERGGRHGGEEPENLRRAEGIESQEGHERDRGRVTPALRVVVIDVDPTLEEIACRGAVLPVEVGLDAVISDAVYDERLDAPVDREDRDRGVGDPAGPSIRRAGRSRVGLRPGPLRLPLRCAPAAPGGGRHQNLRPTASAIRRICAVRAANCSGYSDCWPSQIACSGA